MGRSERDLSASILQVHAILISDTVLQDTQIFVTRSNTTLLTPVQIACMHGRTVVRSCQGEMGCDLSGKFDKKAISGSTYPEIASQIWSIFFCCCA